MRCIPLTVVLLLCCTIACVASVGHKCGIDKIARKAGPPTTVVVREVARQRNSGIQAVTVSLPSWETMRFRVFTEDLDNSSRYCTSSTDYRPDFTGGMVQCGASDVLTTEMRSAIVDYLIPRAVQMHVDRLQVQRSSENIVVPNYTSGLCTEFTIPSNHHTVGVSDADMVLYAAAGPTAGTSLAWALACSTLSSTGRPVVGAMNFGSGVTTRTNFNVRIVAHEIAHALGFINDILRKHTSVVPIPDVRGKEDAFVLASPTVLKKTSEHFNCSSALGMELEDEGGSGTAFSHWERRNAKDELMSGIPGAGYYTALTMAAMEDLGFYKAVWGKEEPMSWGHMSGCALLTDKCVQNGVTKYPDMFCTAKSDELKCTSDRHALGSCNIRTHPSDLYPEYQYFNNSMVGGESSSLMDYCPYIAEYSNTWCTDGDQSSMHGSRISAASRCVKGDSLHMGADPIGDVCAEVSCDNDTVQLRYLGDDKWYECPEGSTITPVKTFTKGKIVCPSRAEVCINLGNKHKDTEDEHDNLGDERNDLSLSISVLSPSVILALVISVIAVC